MAATEENWVSFARHGEDVAEIIGIDLAAQSLESELPRIVVVRAIIPEWALQENRFPNRETLDQLAELYDALDRAFVGKGWLPWAQRGKFRPVCRLNRAVTDGPAIREMVFAMADAAISKRLRGWIADKAPSGDFALEVVDGSWAQHFQPLLPDRFELHNAGVAQLLRHIAGSGEDMEAPHDREHMLVPADAGADPEGAARALREAGFLDVRIDSDDHGIRLFCVSTDRLLPHAIEPVDAQLIEIANRFGMDYDGFEVGPLNQRAIPDDGSDSGR
jgi:hypothetical protein